MKAADLEKALEFKKETERLEVELAGIEHIELALLCKQGAGEYAPISSSFSLSEDQLQFAMRNLLREKMRQKIKNNIEGMRKLGVNDWSVAPGATTAPAHVLANVMQPASDDEAEAETPAAEQAAA